MSSDSDSHSKARHAQDLIVLHAYDAATGKPTMQLSTLTWTGGWPHAALADR